MRVISSGEWLREPELAELKRSFTSWLVGVLIPARVPGIAIPQVADLQEVRSMLAERVVEWTEQWKKEGLEQGLEQALEKSRGILLEALEKRFGSLPEEIRRQVGAIGSIEEVTELSLRVGAASSLEDLKLS